MTRLTADQICARAAKAKQQHRKYSHLLDRAIQARAQQIRRELRNERKRKAA